ncbi:unnamed protein product [Trifolium pratense]|uniref:Uncharacterized protein n=1 Tax=Trifolium pratense TaxID=57577 RepID=A0ACB0ISZ9_TRIPR|nr:unnamed protein product [Trifolium pratense]
MIRALGLSWGVTDDGKGGVHQQKTLQLPNQNEFEVHAKLKKLVIKVDVLDDKVMQKAMKKLSNVSGCFWKKIARNCGK